MGLSDRLKRNNSNKQLNTAPIALDYNHQPIGTTAVSSLPSPSYLSSPASSSFIPATTSSFISSPATASFIPGTSSFSPSLSVLPSYASQSSVFPYQQQGVFANQQGSLFPYQQQLPQQQLQQPLQQSLQQPLQQSLQPQQPSQQSLQQPLQQQQPQQSNVTPSVAPQRSLEQGSQGAPLLSNNSIIAEPTRTSVTKEPIVEEFYRTDVVVEVQPIIHRHVDQEQVIHIEKHITERAREFTGPKVITKEPIVEETVETHIIEEVQPIVHREVVKQEIKREEVHTHENKTASPLHVRGAVPSGVTPHSTVVKPEQIDTTVRTDKLIEVQPIIHRNIEQPHIHHVERHITEVAPSQAGTVVKKPIVHETVENRVIEEIQPIIHRELAIQKIKHKEEIQEEHTVAPIIHTSGKPLGTGLPHSTITLPEQIEETVRKDVLVEVQPVIERTIEQPFIHHVVDHITQPAAPSLAGVVKKQPIVHETTAPKVIEEIQPIVHREMAVQQIERTEELLEERVVAPVVHTHGAPLIDVPHSTITLPRQVLTETRTDKLVEVQPVIERTIEQPRVHHVERHLTDRPAPSLAGTVYKTPIVKEVTNPIVTEEVQPIIHRQRAIQEIEHRDQRIVEHVVAEPQHYVGSATGPHNTIVQKPIVDEVVRKDKLVEVQPIIDRVIEQPRIHHVERHINEQAPPLPATDLVIKKPLVREIVQDNVIEDVQPIIHKEHPIVAPVAVPVAVAPVAVPVAVAPVAVPVAVAPVAPVAVAEVVPVLAKKELHRAHQPSAKKNVMAP